MRFSGCRARRNDAQWSFHCKELQRRHAPGKPCNPARSVLTIRVHAKSMTKLFRTTMLHILASGQRRFLGSRLKRKSVPSAAFASSPHQTALPPLRPTAKAAWPPRCSRYSWAAWAYTSSISAGSAGASCICYLKFHRFKIPLWPCLQGI